MTIAYIGIGGNLAQPIDTVNSAIEALKTLTQSQWLGVSSLYRSKPMGPADQPDYINAVASIDTQLEPLQLLDKLQQIEQQHGRVRKDERWGPRSLDLDLLLFGEQHINHPRLIVPHYGMREREFVLHPLYELQADIIFTDGISLQQLVEQVPANGIEKITIWSSKEH